MTPSWVRRLQHEHQEWWIILWIAFEPQWELQLSARSVRARRFQTRMGVTWVHRSLVTKPDQGRVTHLRKTPRLDAEGSGTQITGGHRDQRGGSVIISQVTTLWSQVCWSAWPPVNSTSSHYTFRTSNTVFVRAPTRNEVFDEVH